MPELPEVETTCRGISPHLIGQTITAVRIFHPRLRWPIPDEVHTLVGRTIRSITRRAKYLLMDCETGHLIVHLGMSGSLRIVAPDAPRGKHDHVEIQVGAQVLRLRDPRRFGAVLWTEEPPHTHPLLAHLGVEPLDAAFDGESLYAQTRKVNTPIKLFVMDAKRVVGVGNIYASESLFLAGIDPRTRAGKLSAARCERLAKAIKSVLRAAIRAGGSSLRDFVGSDGTSGYFQLNYRAYDRAGAPCRTCGQLIRRIVMGQRSTFFCSQCQTR